MCTSAAQAIQVAATLAGQHPGPEPTEPPQPPQLGAAGITSRITRVKNKFKDLDQTNFCRLACTVQITQEHGGQ